MAAALLTKTTVRVRRLSPSASVHLGNDSLLPLLSFYNVMLVRPSSLSPVMQIPFGRTGDRSLTRSPAQPEGERGYVALTPLLRHYV